MAFEVTGQVTAIDVFTKKKNGEDTGEIQSYRVTINGARHGFSCYASPDMSPILPQVGERVIMQCSRSSYKKESGDWSSSYQFGGYRPLESAPSQLNGMHQPQHAPY